MSDKPDDTPDDDKPLAGELAPKPAVDADGKPLDTPPADDADKNADLGLLSDDEPKDDEGAPDQYTFEPPEGVEVTDEIQERLDGFNEAATAMGLSQDQYQALVEYDLSRTQDAESAAVDVWNERVTGWRDASKADKEIGGADFTKNAAIAEATIRQFGDKDLLEVMRSPSEANPNGLALINHPAVLRAFTRIGKALGDPSLLEGDTKLETESSLKRLYPSMFKETA